MARIKYSALVSDMRNKLNGSVLSQNRAGSYVRNKVTPVNPQTSFQQANRQLLGSLSSQWRALTEAARASWRAAVSSFPYTDIFGDRKELDGKALFVKLNMNLTNAGQPTIDTAPLATGVPILELGNVDAVATDGTDPSALVVGVTPDPLPAGYSLMMYATPPILPGRSFVKNQYRFIGTATVTGGDADILSAYQARFAPLAAGDVGKTIHIRAAFVNNETGELGVPVSASGEIILAG